MFLSAPPVPPRQFENTPAVGTKLEGLLLNEFDQDNDFDPRSYENSSNNTAPAVNGNAASPPLCKYFSVINTNVTNHTNKISKQFFLKYINQQLSHLILLF